MGTCRGELPGTWSGVSRRGAETRRFWVPHGPRCHRSGSPALFWNVSMSHGLPRGVAPGWRVSRRWRSRVMAGIAELGPSRGSVGERHRGRIQACDKRHHDHGSAAACLGFGRAGGMSSRPWPCPGATRGFWVSAGQGGQSSVRNMSFSIVATGPIVQRVQLWIADREGRTAPSMRVGGRSCR